MARGRSRLVHPTLAAMVAVVLLSAAAAFARVQDSSAESSLAGRLATVEPASRRVTVLPDGEADLVELMVAADSNVRQDDRELSLSELVIQVGRRVLVRYRVEANRRVAQSIIVEPEG